MRSGYTPLTDADRDELARLCAQSTHTIQAKHDLISEGDAIGLISRPSRDGTVHDFEHVPSLDLANVALAKCVDELALQDTLGLKEFCEKMDLTPSWGVEFAKMRKIAGRLRKAGLEPERI